MTNTATTETKTKGKIFRGVVVSDKMQDTVVVAVARYVKHPKYQKFQKLVKRYHAHNPGNTVKEGETVEIRECRPISKRKHFMVVEGKKKGSK